MGMPNPFAAYRVSDDWAAHRARGSLGGTDWATPVGTPIYAPNPGQVVYEAGNGTGGYIITLSLANSPGYKMQFLHCSSFNGGNRVVKEGELLGHTGGAPGAPGAGSSTGAHVHVHLVDPNGVREDVLPWFANSAPASSATYSVAEVQSLLAARGFYSGAIDGQLSNATWKAIQAVCGQFGFYDLRFHDGLPGRNTYTGMQMYAAKNDNYRASIDGSINDAVWNGFTQSLREDAPKPAPKPPVVVPKPPTTGLTPAKQKKLERLTNLKKQAETKLKEEKSKLPVLIKTQKTIEATLAKVTDVFNKAKAALDKATADVVKSKNDKVAADKGVVSQQSTIATLEKDIARYTEQISKIK
jgi:murein DD-endopeptidase MepM/ murein hydrolase activator NlpD